MGGSWAEEGDEGELAHARCMAKRRESRPGLLAANLLKTLGMAAYFFFNNLSWAMKFNIISGRDRSMSRPSLSLFTDKEVIMTCSFP